MSDRIDDLSERRRRLRARPWDLWRSDQEVHDKRLSKLLEEAFIEKRKRRADVPGDQGARTGRRG